MDRQRLYSYVRQALDEYHMIEDGDKIAIGISGGKDSLTLLYALAGLRRFYPKHFELAALTVDLGYDGFDLTEITALCESLDVEYHVVHTKIGEMVANQENDDRSSRCSLCARLRKGALNDYALSLGCNKIAYAHHRDDVVETLMLSLIYEGRFSSFWPVTPLERTGLTLIRPMIFVPEAEVIGFQHKENLPVRKNPCPYEAATERGYVKDLLDDINRHTPGVRKRLMTAIREGKPQGW